MDIFATTEDDWMPSAIKQNYNEGMLEYSPCSSPLLFGRKAHRQPHNYDLQEEIMFEMPLDGHNQYSDYQLNQENENNELENLLNSLPSPKIRRKIRKPKNVKNKKKSSPLSLLVKGVVNGRESQKNIFNQIEKCKKAKTFIDQLERLLVQLKSQLISTMQANV